VLDRLCRSQDFAEPICITSSCGTATTSSQDSDRRVEGVAPLGAERDIPKIAGGFLRAWARPVNAPKWSAAARRSAPFAERSLTGRDPRSYSLPASVCLGYGRREACRWRACGSFFPKCFSNISRVAARLPRSPRPIWPRSWDQKRCSPSRATVSYSIPHLAWSSPQRVAPGTSEHGPDRRRTKSGRTPDAARARRQRLRCRILRNLWWINTFTHRAPGGSSLAPAAPEVACFQ